MKSLRLKYVTLRLRCLTDKIRVNFHSMFLIIRKLFDSKTKLSIGTQNFSFKSKIGLTETYFSLSFHLYNELKINLQKKKIEKEKWKRKIKETKKGGGGGGGVF